MNLFDGFSIFKDIITLKKDNTSNQTSKKRINRTNTDIYSSNDLSKNIEDIQERGRKRIQQGRNPRKTGIVNPNIHRQGMNKKVVEHFGNIGKASNNKKNIIIHNDESDSDFSDEDSVSSSASSVSVTGDPTLLLTRSTQMVDNRHHERAIIDKRGSSNQSEYAAQFDTMKFDNKSNPVSMNAVNTTGSISNRINTERDLALTGQYSNYGEGYGTTNDMSYGVTNGDFTHNNMVPQFKSKSYGSQPNREEKYVDVARRKVELFSGSESLKPNKTESAPLFEPIMNATNIYGLPVMAGYTSDRYIPGYEKRGEKPFQEKRITPGLNLGYNEENPMGDYYRPAYKSIDELRTADKAQKSYTAPVVTSGLRGTRGPVIGEQKKYRPERTKEWGTERMVKNFGYVYAPSVYGEVNKKNLATVNRGLIKNDYTGPAQNQISQVTSTELREKWDGTLKQEYNEAEPRNLFIVEGQLAREEQEKFIPDPTQRSQNLDYVGPAGTSQIGLTQAFDPNDIPDTTNRSIYNQYDRSGAALTGNMEKGIAYDPSDVPDPTRRNIHDKYDRRGVALTGNMLKGQAYDPNDVYHPTLRDIHNMYDRDGVAITPNSFKGHKYDPNDVPDATLRDVHNRYDRDGVAIVPNSFKGHAYDPNDVPDPTLRNIHNRYDRDGVAIVPNSFKGHAYNPNDVPDATLRNIHNMYDRDGVAITGNSFKGHAYDPNDVPDATLRNVHSKYDRDGAAITGNILKTHAYDPNDVPNLTRREMHAALDRAGAGPKYNEAEKGYTVNYDLLTPAVTRREMHSKLERSAGGAANVVNEKGYTINYDLLTPDITRREIHSKLGRSGGGAANNNTFLPRTRADYENARMNDGKEQIEMIGRTPTYSNYAKGPSADMMMVRVCDKIQINRAALPSTIAINDKLPFVMSTSSLLNGIENMRIDSHTKLNLEGNPYINNMVHKAI